MTLSTFGSHCYHRWDSKPDKKFFFLYRTHIKQGKIRWSNIKQRPSQNPVKHLKSKLFAKIGNS